MTITAPAVGVVTISLPFLFADLGLLGKQKKLDDLQTRLDTLGGKK